MNRYTTVMTLGRGKFSKLSFTAFFFFHFLSFHCWGVCVCVCDTECVCVSVCHKRVKLAKDRGNEDELVAIKMIKVPQDDDNDSSSGDDEMVVLEEKEEIEREEQIYRRQKQIRREIESMEKIERHRNVVHLRGVFEDLEKRRMCLVLEYVGGGDLFELISSRGKLSEHETRRLFWQLMRGLKHIHSSGVVHRDLKPENLLLDHKHRTLKISDFGELESEMA